MMDRLTKLLSEARIGECNNIPLSLILNAVSIESIADHLLENGVIVPPVELNDLVYVVPTRENGLKEVVEMRCIGYAISRDEKNISLVDWKNKLYQPYFSRVGISVFLSRKEAEKALAEREGRG